LFLKSKTIFIVEDNAQNRVVFQMSLIRFGAHVEFERWGASTVARLQNLPTVDLIIMDLMLADGVSGFDLFKEIRALPDYLKVPIVAVSAMDPAVAVARAREMGFSGFIAKPIDKNSFPQQVTDLISGIPVWSMGRTSASI
jgi:two-component system cell cycle response regulator DivK